MTNDVKKVPELRFPEFSGEWEEKMLGDVLTILDGDRGKNYPSGSDFLEYGHTLFLNASNVTKNGFSFTLKQYITEKKSISMGNGKLVKNDVVLTTRGSIGNIGWYDEEIYRKTPYARINSGMLILRSNNKDMASFVSQFLMSTKGKRQIDRISFGSAQPQLTKKDIKLYRIDFPQIKEQQKIGDFFSKLDQQIELEEQKLEKLEEQKKGYMQKIFSKELRFKDENGNNYPEWEEKNLKELIDVRDGTHESPKPSKDGYLLVTSKNLKNSKLDLSESYFISKEDYESINQRSKVEIGDILFGMIGTIGNPILLEECDFAIKNVALLKTNDLLEKYYILNFLKSSNISKQFYRMNAGGTQKFIALSTIRDLNIDMPSSEEAIKIGNFFNKVDNLIENQSNKLELLKKRKQGFLQKMFI
ncbi:restriction endonuclease subunit S [Staphylococcus succinus]|nr:restriction endonuclease subunit S [Staphylococcus succinus]MDH9160500.1 restriction endonuclease subunit S [Staphylococcus succinus]